ncbi:hypothetical protein ACF9IK_14850 [Kitasatospora hibisci]|uniref:hypothetical protein n=1 Tax=Kitasatospora hibisci TaxID=3369522 RepID=UPI0037550E2E
MTTTAASLPRRSPLPLPAPTVPPRREVPPFAPIRRGGGRFHRLRRALWQRPAAPALVLLTVAAALAFGPARAGLPAPPDSALSPQSVHRTGCPSGAVEDHP